MDRRGCVAAPAVGDSTGGRDVDGRQRNTVWGMVWWGGGHRERSVDCENQRSMSDSDSNVKHEMTDARQTPATPRQKLCGKRRQDINFHLF